MVNGRNKGAGFERDVARLFADQLGVDLKRDLEQYRESTRGDLIGLDGMVIECKRYATGPVKYEWWQQVCHAAERHHAVPVLVYKFDRKPTGFRVPVSFIGDWDGDVSWVYYADLNETTFFMLAREWMA